jgi:glycosyltransferase involved in cell wall biosynthesis
MSSDTGPYLSLVIAAYDSWPALQKCLQSVSDQREAPDFEVLIVDDGSRKPPPNSISEARFNFPLRLIRQAHSGIANARNRGIQEAKGSILLFTDCDCMLDNYCLSQLTKISINSATDDCFQLRVTGDQSTLVGRAESLQLLAVQQERSTSSGHLMYLNTSGFAIRREGKFFSPQLFDPSAQRGEDTLLLSTLMSAGQVPRFVADAIVQHVVGLTLIQYILKGLPIGYKEGYAYAKIMANQPVIRANFKQRWQLLMRLFRLSRNESLGIFAFLAIVSRQSLRLFGSWTYRVFGKAANHLNR